MGLPRASLTPYNGESLMPTPMRRIRHTYLLGVLVATGLSLSSETLPAQAPATQTPNARNFDKWLAFIRPSQDELKYEKIGWRNKFWPAVQEAKRLGRPILLWTMNGHPLGCT